MINKMLKSFIKVREKEDIKFHEWEFIMAKRDLEEYFKEVYPNYKLDVSYFENDKFNNGIVEVSEGYSTLFYKMFGINNGLEAFKSDLTGALNDFSNQLSVIGTVDKENFQEKYNDGDSGLPEIMPKRMYLIRNKHSSKWITATFFTRDLTGKVWVKSCNKGDKVLLNFDRYDIKHVNGKWVHNCTAWQESQNKKRYGQTKEQTRELNAIRQTLYDNERWLEYVDTIKIRRNR